MDTNEFKERAERGRMLVSEMSDKTVYDISEIKDICAFAVWQSMYSPNHDDMIAVIRVSIEAAYKLGQIYRKAC